jgi:hypothetical protein
MWRGGEKRPGSVGVSATTGAKPLSYGEGSDVWLI